MEIKVTTNHPEPPKPIAAVFIPNVKTGTIVPRFYIPYEEHLMQVTDGVMEKVSLTWAGFIDGNRANSNVTFIYPGDEVTITF